MQAGPAGFESEPTEEAREAVRRAGLGGVSVVRAALLQEARLAQAELQQLMRGAHGPKWYPHITLTSPEAQ